MKRDAAVTYMTTVPAYGLSPMAVAALNALSREITVLGCDCDDLTCRADAPGYVVTAEVMIHYPDFFMPRRGKCLLYSNMPRTDASYDDTLYADDDPAVALKMLKEVLHKSNSTKYQHHTPALTARERDVLRAIANGLTAKEIANELNISVNTVLTHRKSISAKLGIRSVSGLSLYAVMNGLIK